MRPTRPINLSVYLLRSPQPAAVHLDKFTDTSIKDITTPSAERFLCYVFRVPPLGWKAPSLKSALSMFRRKSLFGACNLYLAALCPPVGGWLPSACAPKPRARPQAGIASYGLSFDMLTRKVQFENDESRKRWEAQFQPQLSCKNSAIK